MTIMDPDSYDLSYLSTSALHCLFDNYLPPNKEFLTSTIKSYGIF